jgi:hypothetical protein
MAFLEGPSMDMPRFGASFHPPGLSSQSRRKTFLRNARQTDELSCGLFLAGAIATIFRLKVLNLAVSDDVRA